MDYREFADQAKEFARDLYEDVEGEGNPPPHAIFETKGELTLAVIDPTFMNDPRKKDLLAQGLAAKAASEGASKFAWILPMWRVLSTLEAAPEDTLRHDPRREEMQQVIVADPERVETWWAKIGRDPVTVGEWNVETGGEPELDYEGRFVDAIRVALR